MKKILLTFTTICIVAGSLFAKEAPRKYLEQSSHAGKIGIGANSQLSAIGLNSLAIRYWPTSRFAMDGLLGFAFGGDNKAFDIGAKFLGVIKAEQNMRLYGAGIIGVENTDINGKSDTAFVIGGGLGVEFFLSGLPNLGFGAEFGVGYDSVTKTFSTVSTLLQSIGIRYYF